MRHDGIGEQLGELVDALRCCAAAHEPARVGEARLALDAEIGRLQAEVEKLKGQLAAGPTVSGKIDEALPKSDPLKKAEPQAREPKVAEGDRKLEIPLPSDQDLDRAMSFLEKAWRRLIDMANRVQKDVSGRI